jgi:hypothetical protein
MKIFEFTASAGVIDASDTSSSGILGTQSSSVSTKQPDDSSILTSEDVHRAWADMAGCEDGSLTEGLLHCAISSDKVVFVLECLTSKP